jgi:serine phosphatase RsbU (regulator of sigma subunit)
LAPGQAFYLTTDGLIDQIGGPRRRAFGKKRLVRFIADHHEHDLPRQGHLLRELLGQHQGNETRRDDVTILGFAPLGSAQEE